MAVSPSANGALGPGGADDPAGLGPDVHVAGLPPLADGGVGRLALERKSC